MSLKPYVCCLAALLSLRAAAQPMVELDNGAVDLGLTLGAEGKLRGTATLAGPTLRVSTGHKGSTPRRATAGFPLEVERLVVHDGVIVFSGGAQDRELIRVHGLELTVENFANRTSVSGQTQVTARGKIGHQGQLDLSVKADPGTSNFSGHAEVVGLGLGELGSLVDRRFDLPMVTGAFSLQLDFSVRDGRIDGTAKPSLAGVGIGIGDSGPIGELKSQLPPELTDLIPGGLGGKLPGGLGDKLPGGLGDKLPGGLGGKEGAAPLSAVIPIHGTLEHPEAVLWTALVDVLRTSFAQASTAGFLHPLPGVGQ